jgi:hypothetical protein
MRNAVLLVLLTSSASLAASGCVDRIRDRIEARLDAGSDAVVDAGPDPLRCDDGQEFVPCGGDPVGEWRMRAFCVDDSGYDPLRGTCEELAADGSGDSGGQLSVYPEGDYRLDWDGYAVEVAFEFPLACFGGSTEPCSGRHYDGTCEIEGDWCTCVVRETREPYAETGFWTASARLLLFETGGVVSEQPFCVSRDGSTLQLSRTFDGVDAGFLATFERVGEGPP